MRTFATYRTSHEPGKKADPNNKTAAENRKARFSYEVLDTLEAGLVLTGTEVKSLRAGPGQHPGSPTPRWRAARSG